MNRKFFVGNLRKLIIYVYHDTLSPSEWKENTPLHVIRPATGEAANVWQYRDVIEKYSAIADGKSLWTNQWNRSQKECIHGPKCKRFQCEIGKATQTIHIISGQFVVLWGYLQNCVPKGKALRLVQVALTDHTDTDKDVSLITGVRVLGDRIASLHDNLKVMEETMQREGRSMRSD